MMSLINFSSANSCSANENYKENFESSIYYSSCKTSYLKVQFYQVDLIYKINVAGHLSEDSIPLDFILDEANRFATTRTKALKNLDDALQKTAENIRLIVEHLNIGGVTARDPKIMISQFKEAISEFNRHNKIKFLDLRGIGLSLLPSQICNLTNLEEVDLSDNQLSFLPSHLWKISSLKKLNIENNRIDYPVLQDELGRTNPNIKIITGLTQREQPFHLETYDF